MTPSDPFRNPDAAAHPAKGSEASRNQLPRRAAAIDVGTNTVRLLVGEADAGGRLRTLFAAQEITRLGEGLLPDRLLRPIPVERTLAALSRCRAMAADHGAEAIVAAGTSALREARNRDAFLRRAAAEAGVRVRVISGHEEARLTLQGVLGAFANLPAGLLLMDIGGGSTEFLAAEGDRIRRAISTGLGVVKLTEAHVRHDPPLPGELARIRTAATLCLDRICAQEFSGGNLPALLVGTGGTVTTLAAVDLGLAAYDPARITGRVLSRGRIAELVERLAGQPVAARRQVPGLEPGREDVIIAGGLVCLASMEALGFSTLMACDAGLREGLLLAALSASPGR
jgi:exopolyphosphatase/guanosine-5'-triphosphate,3'-diphosphate pyrophosphatase